MTRLNFGSVPYPKLPRLAASLLSHAQSYFRPPALIRYSCLTCRYLSSRNMVTFIRPSTRDQFTDLKVPKLDSLTEIPPQILSRPQIRNFPNRSSYKIMARTDLRARITAAIHAIESGEYADYTEAALKYGVDRTTIPALSSAMAELKHTSPKSPELSIRSVSGRALSPFYSQKSTLRCLFLFFGYLGDSLSGIISECSPVILLDFKRSIGRVRCENRLESPS